MLEETKTNRQRVAANADLIEKNKEDCYFFSWAKQSYSNTYQIAYFVKDFKKMRVVLSGSIYPAQIGELESIRHAAERLDFRFAELKKQILDLY